MAKKQYFGIKYPFSDDGFEKFTLDLNTNERERVASELLHLIFTPKRQRIRMPEFGTDLIKFIFQPNDSDTWESVKTEIQNSVTKWISNVKLNDIQVMSDENGLQIFVRIDYSVIDGNYSYNNSIAVQI